MPHSAIADRWTSITALLICAGLALGMGHLHADRPEHYPPMDPLKVGDGKLTYVVNMDGLLFSTKQDYSANDVAAIEDAIARAFETWADVLAPLNLEFERLPKWRASDLPVITFDYEFFIPDCLEYDTLAGAHSLSIFGLFFASIPIIFDNTELFVDLADEPVVVDRPMAHPYTCYTASAMIDVYSAALHEIGHVLGLAHPSDSYKRNASYNFLALDSVRIDPSRMRPSGFVCGEDIARRRPLLRTEIDSVMRVPLEPGARYMDIPPADRAFLAFALRYLNPSGADEILAEARRIFLETSPLRFGNVFEEYEKDPPDRSTNDTLENAQAVEPNSIILGSIVVTEGQDGRTDEDVDFYVFEVTDRTVDADWFFDIDHGGGLIGPSWVDAKIELRDGDGNVLAENTDANEIDAGSISTVDPFLTHRFDSAGKYYIVITSESTASKLGATGDYEFKIGVGSVPEPRGSRQIIPALADSSVAECLGTGPIDTSSVPCQMFGILAAGLWTLAALALASGRRHAGCHGQTCTCLAGVPAT